MNKLCGMRNTKVSQFTNMRVCTKRFIYTHISINIYTHYIYIYIYLNTGGRGFNTRLNLCGNIFDNICNFPCIHQVFSKEMKKTRRITENSLGVLFYRKLFVQLPRCSINPYFCQNQLK